MKRRRSFVSNILAVAWKEWRVMRHDTAFLMMMLAQPLMMFTLFGFVLSNEPANVPWLVLDQSRTTASRRLVSEIGASGYFLSPQAAGSHEEGAELLSEGTAIAFLVVPSDFGRAAERGRPRVQLLLDGADPLTSARVAGIITSIAREAQVERVPIAADERRIDLRGHFRFNATLEDRIAFLSVFAGMLLTNVTLSIMSLSLVGERESGTYEQALAQPTRPIELVLGKILPNVGVCGVMLVIAVAAPGIAFGFWPRGSWIALVAATVPFVLASLSTGVLVSSLVSTSAQAVFISPFFIMPSFVLSGVMLPYQLMPDGVRQIGYLFPLRWYLVELRTIVVRGGGLAEVWVPMLGHMAIFGVLLAFILWKMKPRLG